MAGIRIRWRGVARVVAILFVVLVALRLVPSLIRAPEPPPLGRDVGLPGAMAGTEVEDGRRHGLERAARPRTAPRQPHPTVGVDHGRTIRQVPASTATIGSHHRHKPASESKQKPRSSPPPSSDSATPAEPAAPPEPSAPPAPEYVPPPVPEPAPEPLPAPSPAPSPTPGDGSEEFAPR